MELMILKIMSHGLEVKLFLRHIRVAAENKNTASFRLSLYWRLLGKETSPRSQHPIAVVTSRKRDFMLNRRTFLQSAAKTATIAAATRLQPLVAQSSTPVQRSSNDLIQFALIGAGIQGQGDTRTAVQV